MQIKDLLKDYKVKEKSTDQQKSERAEIVKKFVDRLNEDRVAGGFKALGAGVYAIKMAKAGLKTNDSLYRFYAYCDDAQNFSSTWWWAIKNKSVKK